MEYRSSRYNYIKPVEDQYLVYNLSSDAIAVLDETTLSQLSKPKDAELLDTFCSLGFLVPYDVDEVALVNSRRYATMFGDFKSKSFTILPTTACNARCFYCYEEGWKPRSMNSATAHATAEFIESECAGGGRANLVWFGGEPLLGIDSIRVIVEKLSSRMKDRFTSSIVTNGYLLTPEIIKESVDSWNLASIQVALDGVGSLYNDRKAYVDANDDAFQRVIANIDAALDAGINVTARINIDKRNYRHSDSTLAYLSSKYSNQPRFDAYFYPLQCVGEKTASDYFTEDDYPEVMSQTLLLRYKYGFLKNFDYATYPLVNAGCSARTLSGYVIDPLGDLYKCQHTIEGDCIGNVFEGPRFNQAYSAFCNPDLPEECDDCIYLPKCHGGCLVHHLRGNATCPKCQMIKYDIEQRCEILYKMSVEHEA